MGTLDTTISREAPDANAPCGSITVPATLEHLDDIYEQIHVALAREGCPPQVKNQLDVVLEELFVNVCSYAYGPSGMPGNCRLEYMFRDNPRGIVIRVTDWGTPFDPLAHADPESPKSIAETKIGGLGILMVKRLTDRVSYEHASGANILTFKKDW